MSAAHENVKVRYQQIAYRKAQQVEETRQNAYAKVPELAGLETELLQVNLDILQSGINKRLDRTALKTRRDALTKEIAAKLTQNGFAADALIPKAVCAICGDTGVAPNGGRCACYDRYLLEARIKDSGLPEHSGSFETFDAGVFSDEKGKEKVSQRQYMQTLKERCEKYAAAAFEDGEKNLILMGSAGTGKSFLAQAVVTRALQNGQIAMYTTAGRLFKDFYNHRLGENVDLERYEDVPLLAIDDLGTEIMTKNVTVEYFYNLISARETMGKATVIATNLTPEDFVSRYGDRIYSRLFSKISAKYLIPAGYPDIRKN